MSDLVDVLGHTDRKLTPSRVAATVKRAFAAAYAPEVRLHKLGELSQIFLVLAKARARDYLAQQDIKAQDDACWLDSLGFALGQVWDDELD